jgi:tRNA threonylcarbamoyladenosine biosynthesis protein TsaB
MLVLGIDTATWTATVGLVRDETVLAETSEVARASHGASLPRLVESTVAAAGVRLHDVEGIAVSIGPGSFTGLRIGLSLAKGMAFAGGLPLAAVPTLEALAAVVVAPPGATVWAALDARMREVYAAPFRAAADGPERLGADEALAPDVLAARLGPEAILVGDAADAYPVLRERGARVLPFATHHPRGGVVARLGARLLAAGRGADPGPLEPAYVRASQAETARRR